jgi:ABC-type glutathione transport system ATPase component
MSLLDVRNLTVDLPTAAGWIRPVNEVSFQLAPAESLGLVGESGSGKTMLALALMGLLLPGARVAGSAVLKRGETNASNLTQLNEKPQAQRAGLSYSLSYRVMTRRGAF